MKIAILSTVQGYSWAGTEEVWRQCAALALERGHEVCLLADELIGSSEQCRALQSAGLRISIRRQSSSHRLSRLKILLRADHHDALDFTPDVLLINAGSPFDLQYCPNLGTTAAAFACPKVFYCHFNSDRLPIPPKPELRKAMADFKHFIFVCEANRQLLEMQICRPFPASTVVLNSPRITRPDPIPFPPDNAIRFASVARLETAWKGQDILAPIMATSTWRQRSSGIDLWGEGPDRNYLTELYHHFGVSDHIRFAGYSHHIEDIWTDTHALLMPSRGEGTPLAALEAMMCGRIVIGTDVGGLSELIEDGVTGYIAEAPTVRSFESAMERAWHHRDDWPAMGTRAHERAHELKRTNPAAQVLELLEGTLPP